MNHTLENAALVATFIGGISGLWYLWDQFARVARRFARTKHDQEAAIVKERPRRSFVVTSIFALALGGSLSAFFASDVKNAFWFLAYIGVAATAGATELYLVEDKDIDTTWHFSKRVGWPLLGALLCGMFAAYGGILLLPNAIRAFANAIADQPIVSPPYLAPLIGGISGIAGGFFGPKGSVSKHLRLVFTLAQAIAVSVGFVFMLSVSSFAYYSEHRPGIALVFLGCSIVVMFAPLFLRDSE